MRSLKWCDMEQHSGQQEELRDAMDDVANTVEYILDIKEKRDNI